MLSFSSSFKTNKCQESRSLGTWMNAMEHSVIRPHLSHCCLSPVTQHSSTHQDSIEEVCPQKILLRRLSESPKYNLIVAYLRPIWSQDSKIEGGTPSNGILLRLYGYYGKGYSRMFPYIMIAVDCIFELGMSLGIFTCFEERFCRHTAGRTAGLLVRRRVGGLNFGCLGLQSWM